MFEEQARCSCPPPRRRFALTLHMLRRAQIESETAHQLAAKSQPKPATRLRARASAGVAAHQPSARAAGATGHAAAAAAAEPRLSGQAHARAAAGVMVHKVPRAWRFCRISPHSCATITTAFAAAPLAATVAMSASSELAAARDSPSTSR